MKLDRIFIINLKHRKDRKIQIIKELHRVKASNYEFFEAIKPTEKTLYNWSSKYLDPLPDWFINTKKNHLKYRIGALGCLKSHYEIIKICKQRGYKNVLILEDDTKFVFPENISLEEKLNSLSPQLNQIIDQYGLLYLVGNHKLNFFRQVSNNLLMTRYTLTTGSYIVSEKAMDLILENLNGYNREIDVFYVEKVQQQLPCFVLHPHIAGQTQSYSDIAQCNVNYNL
jgi:GR25 family glycosyltransferase involved in LPS biosynthesis